MEDLAKVKPVHTPGPWCATDEDIFDCGLLAIEGPLQEYVCHVEGWQDRPTEAAANKFLIAAAPDLLAACKAALNVVREVRTRVTGTADIVELQQIEHDLSATIKAATPLDVCPVCGGGPANECRCQCPENK